MRLTILLLLFNTLFFQANAQTNLAMGQQPQISVDPKGAVRLVFGNKNQILYAISVDNGQTFSPPVLVGEIDEMHLGMTRGPQLASSKDYSMVTAMDKKGNIHAFRLTHKTDKWEKLSNVNDHDSSAPEGLMSVAADNNNNFYAVWLDLREERKNNICFSKLSANASWGENRFVYKSPENHVCECCKPAIAIKANKISIMFRNWLKGSRDLYFITSENGGETFSYAQKLGNGTWQLKGCPMDGGGISIDSKNQIHTAWQREGQIYYALPGKTEELIGEGRNVGLQGNLVTWEKGSELIVHRINGAQQKIGEGTALRVYEFQDKSILAIWEKGDQIVIKKI